MTAPAMTRPLRRHLARWLDSPAMLVPDLMTLMWAGTRGYHAEPKFPAILTDDELRAIDMPVSAIAPPLPGRYPQLTSDPGGRPRPAVAFDHWLSK